jgi:hypothetical protein
MKPRPINIKVEAERMERDAAARWLAKHDTGSTDRVTNTEPQQHPKWQGGARR